MIFLAISLDIQLNGVKYTHLRNTGCDIRVVKYGFNFDNSAMGISQSSIARLNAFAQQNYPYVRDWSWNSRSLVDIIPKGLYLT